MFFALVLSVVLRSSASEVPAWAYVVNPPVAQHAVDDGQIRHVPNSTVTLNDSQLALQVGVSVPDWHPEEHPVMPQIVGQGREPRLYACAYCHLPSGAGRPENSNLTGLTASYIRQQMLAFRNGERPGSEPRRLPQTLMIAVAQGVTEAEVEQAASYFSSLRPVSFVTVKEAALVPITVVDGWILKPAPGNGTEPVASRIVEVADDFGRFENRDSRTPYVAYVPLGSLKRGAELIAMGRGPGRSLRCITCHGKDLKGVSDIPRLAGRSPTYLVRQLHDMRDGKRTGGMSLQMKAVLGGLSDEDIVALAAYCASREP